MDKHRPKTKGTYDSLKLLALRHYWYVNLGLIVLGLVTIFARRIDSVANPQFWAEDGYTFFADAYNLGRLHSVFMPYAGYFTLFDRLVSSAVASLPLQYAPFLFNVISGVLIILPAILINTARLRFLFPNRWVPLVIGFLYISLPNSSEVSLNLTNSQWHLAVLMFLVVIAKPSHKLFWWLFDFGILISGGLTGPLSILLTPFALYRWWKLRTRQSLYKLGVVATTGCIQVACLALVSNAQRGGELANANFSEFTKILGGQIFVGAVLGVKHIAMFESQPLITIMTICGTAILVYTILKGPVELKLFSLYSLIVFMASLAALKGVSYNVWDALIRPGTGQRYFFVPMVAWMVSLVWFSGRLKPLSIRCAAIVLLACCFAIGIVSDFKHSPYQDYHFQQEVRAFNKQPKGASFTFPINPAGWTMILNKK